MDTLKSVYHCTPLNYAPFVFRTKGLLSRRQLVDRGFNPCHFRKTSSQCDVDRGFADVVFCTTAPMSELLKAKLKHGFPHYLIEIPTHLLQGKATYLCRYNIARSRYYRGAKREPSCDPDCEFYVKDFRLPVARTDDQKRIMLQKWSNGRVLEILVESRVDFDRYVKLIAFSKEDQSLLGTIAKRLEFQVEIELAEFSYVRCAKCAVDVGTSIESALADHRWKGNGLDYDSLRHT